MKILTLQSANICCTKIQHHYKVTSIIQNDDVPIIINSEHYVMLDGDDKFVAIEDSGIASVQIGETKSSSDEVMEMLFESLGTNATEVLIEIEKRGMEEMGWNRPENQSQYMQPENTSNEMNEIFNHPFFKMMDVIMSGQE